MLRARIFLSSIFVATTFVCMHEAVAESAASLPTVELTIRAVVCPRDATDQVRMTLDGRSVSSGSNVGGFPEFEVRVTPHPHIVDLQTAHCSFSGAISLIPGHSRSVTAVLSSAQVVSNGTSTLVGVLALSDAQVSLFKCGGSEQRVSFDGGAYYAERLTPGEYVLRLSLSPAAMQIRIPVTVRLGENRLDVTRDKIIGNLGYRYTIEGGDRVFHPLWRAESLAKCRVGSPF